MPDPTIQPYAKEVRNRMDEAPAHSLAQRQLSSELLKLILGRRETDPSIGPPPWHWLADPEKAYSASNERDMPLQEDVNAPPHLSAAFDVMQREYPTAAARVNWLFGLPDPPEEPEGQGRLGVHSPFGGIGLRTYLRGQPISMGGIIGTLAHEMAHGMGALDFPDNAGVSAYDVGHARDNLNLDQNLPNERPITPPRIKAFQQDLAARGAGAQFDKYAQQALLKKSLATTPTPREP